MPGDRVLRDGHAAELGFALKPNIKLWVIEVMPSGLTGQGGIDQTHLGNATHTTQWPKSLSKSDRITAVVKYAPDAFVDIVDMHRVNQLITTINPDSTTIAQWGWLEEWKPKAFKTGELPTADIVIEISNLNDDDEEVVPVYDNTP